MDPSAATRLAGMVAAAREVVASRVKDSIPDSVAFSAILAVSGYFYDRPTAAAGDRFASGWHNSGAAAMCRDWTNRRAIVLPFVGEAAEPAAASVMPAPIPVPTVFDLRFGSRANLGFVASDFDTLGDSADGVMTADVSGPTVYAAIWLPNAAPDPLTILRDDLSVPNLFVVGPTVLELGGIPGRYWRTSAPFRRWSASRLDVRFPA